MENMLNHMCQLKVKQEHEEIDREQENDENGDIKMKQTENMKMQEKWTNERMRRRNNQFTMTGHWLERVAVVYCDGAGMDSIWMHIYCVVFI